MDKGGNTVVQKNVSEPPAYLKDSLAYLANTALTQAKGGVGPTYHSGYVAPNADQTNALNQLRTIAGQDPGLAGGLLGNLQGPLQDIISGRTGITVPQIGANNPNVMASLDYSAGKAKHLLDTSYGGAGRYMSPEYGAAVTDSIGNLYSTGLMNQYNQDVQNRQQAEAANIANRAGAISSYGGLASLVDPLRYAGANQMLTLGGAEQQDAQQKLADINAGKTAAETRPWDILSFLNQNIAGVAPYGGTQTSYAPNGSPLSGALGGGLLGAGAANLMGLGGGAALGLGGAGGLLGLLGAI